ncbi:hypothetical protein HK105_200634 [Polyrhizophydium stewartii]|uniref:Histone RNA hairpin-binding protein RNA-binding domain-containing protein n=1 Tax=Polyrhizophydium stewartii TaxID=2732419 RepID=A0ABR4NJM1_9FUNG
MAFGHMLDPFAFDPLAQHIHPHAPHPAMPFAMPGAHMHPMPQVHMHLPQHIPLAPHPYAMQHLRNPYLGPPPRSPSGAPPLVHSPSPVGKKQSHGPHLPHLPHPQHLHGPQSFNLYPPPAPTAHMLPPAPPVYAQHWNPHAYTRFNRAAGQTRQSARRAVATERKGHSLPNTSPTGSASAAATTPPSARAVATQASRESTTPKTPAGRGSAKSQPRPSGSPSQPITASALEADAVGAAAAAEAGGRVALKSGPVLVGNGVDSDFSAGNDSVSDAGSTADAGSTPTSGKSRARGVSPGSLSAAGRTLQVGFAELKPAASPEARILAAQPVHAVQRHTRGAHAAGQAFLELSESQASTLHEGSFGDEDWHEVQSAADSMDTGVSTEINSIVESLITQSSRSSNLPNEPSSEARRLEQRQKQIDYGKNTIGYRNYINSVPKNKRRKGEPETPDKHSKCSKRAWDAQVRSWRRRLHLWDPPGETAAGAGDSVVFGAADMYHDGDVDANADDDDDADGFGDLAGEAGLDALGSLGRELDADSTMDQDEHGKEASVDDRVIHSVTAVPSQSLAASLAQLR